MSAARATRGTIVYDNQCGHICTCTAASEYDKQGNPLPTSYLPTVSVDRDTRPTDSGSWFYVCDRCGAGAWSGV